MSENRWQGSVPNKLWRARIYKPIMSEAGRPHLPLTVAILAKGRCFFGPSARSLRPCRNINLLFQQINIARGYCWGPSASEGPQKHDLTMFSKWNMWTGIFGIGLLVYKSMIKTKLEWDGRRLWRRIRWSRSYAQRSFGMTVEKGNRPKDEKPN